MGANCNELHELLEGFALINSSYSLRPGEQKMPKCIKFKLTKDIIIRVYQGVTFQHETGFLKYYNR